MKNNKYVPSPELQLQWLGEWLDVFVDKKLADYFGSLWYEPHIALGFSTVEDFYYSTVPSFQSFKLFKSMIYQQDKMIEEQLEMAKNRYGVYRAGIDKYRSENESTLSSVEIVRRIPPGDNIPPIPAKEDTE